MGDYNVRAVGDKKELQHFMKCLLKDVHALEHMLREDWFETDTIRIGAEQEMCLVNSKTRKPASVNLEALKLIDDPDFTTELARFNLEANLMPLTFEGKCLSQMHTNLRETLEKAIAKVKGMGVEMAFTGILPTLRKSDVDIEHITPIDRYHALMDGLKQMRGDSDFEMRIAGLDEMNLMQKTAMLEACNTSFQVHLQVKPNEFAELYNIAQAITGPVMASAVNSPMLFGRRLWKETRIALFQQSIDIRVFNEHLRESSPRVTFGNDWLNESITEIYHEDISRYKVLLSTDIEEDVFEQIKNGITPKLRALNIHNSTVYRWNRPCYGISENGQPHLRIENRIFPAGPSLPDEMANASFWLGLMNGMGDEQKDMRKVMHFEDARNNFFTAAQFGLDNKFRWFNGQRIRPSQLILEQLLPIARHGLSKQNIAKDDIDYYLGIIEERVKSGQTGSQWMLDSYAEMRDDGMHKDEIFTTITASIVKHQYDGTPVHEWKPASSADIEYAPGSLRVEEFMNTDIFTANEEDIIELVAKMMDWRRIRHVLIEDDNGKLVGLVSSRQLLRYYTEKHISEDDSPIHQVKEIMVKDVITVEPGDSILKAMELMRKHRIGCLPVCTNGHLTGVITEHDFVNLTGQLIKRMK